MRQNEFPSIASASRGANYWEIRGNVTDTLHSYVCANRVICDSARFYHLCIYAIAHNTITQRTFLERALDFIKCSRTQTRNSASRSVLEPRSYHICAHNSRWYHPRRWHHRSWSTRCTYLRQMYSSIPIATRQNWTGN